MEMKTNLSAVQEYATNTLKMVKMDRSQVDVYKRQMRAVVVP